MKMLLNFFLLTLFAANVTNASVTDRDKAELGVERNYITNGGCESSTAGFKAFNTSFSGGLPGSITLGSTKVSVARVTTNILAGQASCQFNLTDASSSEGHGIISDVFTIKDGDLAKALALFHDYNFVAGSSNVDTSGTSTQTLEIWVYNVGLSQWLQPSGFRSINTKGVPDTTPEVAIQADSSNASNKNQYRIAWIVRNAPSGTFQMNFDAVTFGRQKKSRGPSITDWNTNLSFTPNSGAWGTVTNSNSYTKRVGDTLKVRLNFQGGTSSTGTAQFALPSGLSIDLNKLKNTGINDLGNWWSVRNPTGPNTFDNSTVAFGAVFSDGVDASTVFITNKVGSNVFTKIGGNIVSASSDSISAEFEIPIVGWSSNSELSSSTDTRVAGLFATLNTNGAAGTGTVDVAFDSASDASRKEFDTHGMLNTSTGVVTIPINGLWEFSPVVNFASCVSQAPELYLTDTSNNIVSVINGIPTNATTGCGASGSVTIKANAGDQYKIRINKGGSGSPQVLGSPTYTHLNVKRLSGPSVIAASETVAAAYTGNNSSSLSNTQNVLKFLTKEYDTHGAYDPSTGIFTCPIPGKYSIDALMTITGTVTASNASVIYIYKNGSPVRSNTFKYFGATATGTSIPVSGTVDCLAGQTFAIYTYTEVSGPSFSGTAHELYFNIIRTGN